MYKALSLPQEFIDLWTAPVVFSTGSNNYYRNKVTDKVEKIKTSPADVMKNEPFYITMHRRSSSHCEYAWYFIYDRPEQNAIDIYYSTDLYFRKIEELKYNLKEHFMKYTNRAIGIRYFLNEHQAYRLYLKSNDSNDLAFCKNQYDLVDELPDNAIYQHYHQSPRPSWIINCWDLRHHQVSLDFKYRWFAGQPDDCVHPDSLTILKKLYGEPQATRFIATVYGSNFLSDDGNKRALINLTDVILFITTEPYKRTLTRISSLCNKVACAIKSGATTPEQPINVIKDDKDYGVYYQSENRAIVYDINNYQCSCYDIKSDSWVSGEYKLYRNTLEPQVATKFDDAIGDELTKIDPTWNEDDNSLTKPQILTQWLKWPAWAKKHKVSAYMDEFKQYWKQQFFCDNKTNYEYIDICNEFLPATSPYTQYVLYSCANNDQRLNVDTIRAFAGEKVSMQLLMAYFNLRPLELANVIRFSAGYFHSRQDEVEKYLNKYYGIRNDTPQSLVDQLIFLAGRESNAYACELRLKVDDVWRQPHHVDSWIIVDMDKHTISLRIHDKKPNYRLLCGAYQIKWGNQLPNDASLETQMDFITAKQRHDATVSFEDRTIGRMVTMTYNTDVGFYQAILDMQETYEIIIQKDLIKEFIN